MSGVESYTATEQDIIDTRNAREERARTEKNELVSTSRVVDGSASVDSGGNRTGGTLRHVAGTSDLTDALPLSGFQTKDGQAVSLSAVTGDTLVTLPGRGQYPISFCVEQGILDPKWLSSPVEAAQEMAAAAKAAAEAKLNERIDVNDPAAIEERLLSVSAEGYSGAVDDLLHNHLETEGGADPAMVDIEGIAKALGMTAKGGAAAFETIIASKSALVDAAIAPYVNDFDAFYRFARQEHGNRYAAAFRETALSGGVGGWLRLAQEWNGMNANGMDVNPSDVVKAFNEGKFGANVVNVVQGANGVVLVETRDGQILDSRSALKHGVIKMGSR